LHQIFCGSYDISIAHCILSQTGTLNFYDAISAESCSMNDPLERVIRPIVEGQLRDFCISHPTVVEAVDWYKPRSDKSQTFINSIAKRVLRDLLSASSRERIANALIECWEANQSAVAPLTAADNEATGILTGASFPSDRGTISAADAGLLALRLASPSRSLLPQIQWVAA
jgi:hypothetical protein